MKVILIQSGNYKFYYGRYTEDDQSQKRLLHLNDNREQEDLLYIEIPIYILQPYKNKGPKDDKSIDSIWESQVELDSNSINSLQNQGYGSKQLVVAMLVSLGFKEIESKEEKRKVQVYHPGQEKIAYDELDSVDKVLKGNLL
jgi:hypothetical protein